MNFSNKSEANLTDFQFKVKKNIQGSNNGFHKNMKEKSIPEVEVTEK